MNKPLRIAMLISGGGTTMSAIIEACKTGCLQGLVEPVLVIASNNIAEGIQKADQAGIAKKNIVTIRPKDLKTENDPQKMFGEKIIEECEKRNVQFIGQYGWLAYTPANVIGRYQGMMVNQHPGPLDPGYPDFGGQGMYGRRVLAARLIFVRLVNREKNFWTEATAQRVHTTYDKGAILLTERVEISPTDDLASLQAKMLPVEHKVQIEVLRRFATNTVEDYKRPDRLILDTELQQLEQAKQTAIALFPKG